MRIVLSPVLALAVGTALFLAACDGARTPLPLTPGSAINGGVVTGGAGGGSTPVTSGSAGAGGAAAGRGAVTGGAGGGSTPVTSGSAGAGGAAAVGGASADGGTLDRDGGTCSPLAPSSDAPLPVPPGPGCPCTRRPGQGNSYKCPMGAGQTVTALIDASGGTLVLGGQQGPASGVNFQITFPPLALAGPTQISVTETSLPPPAELGDWSPVYLMEPVGLKLAKVAALRIPWSNVDSTVPPLAIYERTPSGPCDFERLADSYTNAGFEQASLVQLGYVVVGTPIANLPASCRPDAGATP
jgi:hypothetical protein